MTEDIAREGTSIIVLPDRLDSMTANGVERTIIDALTPGAGVIIDGQGVGYMSAAGVRTLATVLHKAEQVKAHLVFCRFTGPAADCLVVSGFNALFEVADSVEDAQGKLKIKQSQPTSDLAPMADDGLVKGAG